MLDAYVVPDPFILMYGHNDGAGVDDAFREVAPPFTVIEGTSADAAFITEMRAQGVIYAAHVNNSTTATKDQLVAAWRVPFDNDLGGALPGGEVPKGPLMFQGNHGPVAYRNIVVKRFRSRD